MVEVEIYELRVLRKVIVAIPVTAGGVVSPVG